MLLLWGVSLVNFLSDFGFSDCHQVDQLGCESHTSCKSESILLGRALQTWLVDVEVGVPRALSSDAASSYCAVKAWIKFLKECSSALYLKIMSTKALGGLERSSSLTAALLLSGVGCWEGGSGVESGLLAYGT